MSKNIKIAALGIAAFATAAAPMMAMAEVPTETDLIKVDSIAVTIDATCKLSRKVTVTGDGGHTAGDAAPNATGNVGTWSGDKLSGTMVAGSYDTNFGSSKFNVVCNDTKGYKVTLDATDLVSTTKADDKIVLDTKAAAAEATSSYWTISSSVANAGSAGFVADGGTVATGAATKNAGDDFTITYGVAIKDGQPAGTYEGYAEYTLAVLQPSAQLEYSTIKNTVLHGPYFLS